MKTLFLPFLLAFGAPLAAQVAQPSVALDGDVKLERTVVVDGTQKVELVEPDVVVPGDKLVFTTRYRNAGVAPADNFAITNVLPASVMLASDDPADHLVSVDGGKSWGQLASLTIVSPDGASRAATASDVTHLRWALATIAPGGSGKFEYRALVR